MERRVLNLVVSLLVSSLPIGFAAADDEPKEDRDIEVVPVTGRRIQKTEAEDISKIEISREEAELVAPSGDVAQVPKLFPGTLARPQDSQVAIRGSDRGESIYLIDNLQAPNLFEPISGTSVIPTRAISSLQYFPGNFDAQYGNSTGGVIRLETRGADIDEPYSEFRLNLPIYVSAYHEQAVSANSSIIVSTRKSTLEPFVKAAVQEEGLVLLPYFQDIYLQHAYDTSEWSVKSRFVHSMSGAELSVYNDRASNLDGTSDFDFKNGYNLFGVDIQRRFDYWTLRFDPYYSKAGTEFTANDVFFKIDFDSVTIPLRTQVEVSRNFNIFLGMKSIYTDFKLNALVPDTVGQGPFADPENTDRVALNVDSTLRHDAAWSTFEWGVGDFVVTPSLRLFQQSNIDEAGFDPRFALRWRLGNNDTLKFGVGQYSLAPAPQELDESFGNPELSWIRSTHYTVGWETFPFGLWSSDIQLFYKEWDDLTLEDPFRRFVPETVRNTKGFEWFLRYSDGFRWFGWLAYTYSVSKEQRSNIAQEIFADNDSTHILHLVANFRVNDNWQIGSRFKHQTGFVYTPIADVFYQANTDTYQPVTDPLQTNSRRVPDATSFSLFAQVENPFKNWTLITRLGFEEYQFRKSSPNIQYNYNFTQKEYTTGLPVIPFIELRAIL